MNITHNKLGILELRAVADRGLASVVLWPRALDLDRIMADRHVIDASALVGAVNSVDVSHVASSSLFQEYSDDTFVVPTLACFEFQTAQSRLRREGRNPIREM